MIYAVYVGARKKDNGERGRYKFLQASLMKSRENQIDSQKTLCEEEKLRLPYFPRLLSLVLEKKCKIRKSRIVLNIVNNPILNDLK